ncbi:MAG: DNA repair protein RadA [Elusimicrobia bacterium RIFCSPLOWO2_01_FULL_64_13]|nr:MAG: DNA repair protein RadA [Elusimicrobia bacterium RIFCSPHIGHO2_01_FULL_64_10]OGR97448.1 MAG: DNA repair protein RadA [Elusimicrobia bacterium RIFCSPLOWO2_01_FULL_64_13]
MKPGKEKTAFRCQECGVAAIKWLGRCPDCGKWNSFVEERQVRSLTSPRQRGLTDFTSQAALLSEVSAAGLSRIPTGIAEFDRMIGGGLVPGSLVLLGGSPGIGKSTLMLQIAALVARERTVLYISGEESQEQVKGRAERLGLDAGRLYLLSETSLEEMVECVRKVKPELVVVDSIQTTVRMDLASAPGSVGQVRECAAEFLRLAKSTRTVFALLGHVTKEGDLAGPRVLEHIVDTVLYFETEKQELYRVLRAVKNRFGPTSEIGIFEMRSSGLVEVPNPSVAYLAEHRRGPGSLIVAALEGSRPMLLEIQALVSRTPFGYPRRMVTGIDVNRALLAVAVLEKRLGVNLSNQDIFVNVAGGAKIREPAGDLGLACAIAGAFGNFYCDSDGIAVGEVGLGGEIRSVGQISERLREAQRMGMAWALIPQGNLKDRPGQGKMEIVPVGHVGDAVRWLKSRAKDHGPRVRESAAHS